MDHLRLLTRSANQTDDRAVSPFADTAHTLQAIALTMQLQNRMHFFGTDLAMVIEGVEDFGERLVAGRTLEALDALTSLTVLIDFGMVAEGTAHRKHTITTTLLFYLPTLVWRTTPPHHY